MSEIQKLLSGLSARARWVFVSGLAAILIVALVMAWWVLHPSFAPLAQNLRPSDASEIGTALSTWGVPYRFDEGDKTVLVPSDQLYETRMKLAAEGIPKGGSVGFEAFKDSDYGVTEFAQQVNYQRALQGELERTIDSMPEVESARVHLTIHHAGLFEQDQEPSKASVTLHLRPAQHVAAKQVVGIQRLVASAVDTLQPQAVTVLDQDGTTLSGSGAGAFATSIDEQVDDVARLEQHLRQQVSDLLIRALHRDDFTVSVAVQLSYDHVKRIEQRLLALGKDGNGLLVHEKTDSSRSPAATSTIGALPANTVTSRDAEYAHGNEQEEVEEAPGRIQRISVGVVIPAALAPPDLKDLSDVVAAGIGLDKTRGDHIDIAAITPWIPPEQNVALKPPSEIGAPLKTVPHEAASNIPSTSWPLNLPIWMQVGAGGGVLVLMLGVFAVARGSRGSLQRLSAPERDAMLDRIVQWIELPERTP